MTTNRTRAEQIWATISGDACPSADECLVLIEQALDEAVRDAHDLLRSTNCAECSDLSFRAGKKEGTLAGLEMCKSIVRDEAKITGDFYLPNLLASHILERISAKAKELGVQK